MAAEALPAAEPCFHCGLPVPIGVRIEADVLGARRTMCCIGCRAVAEMLEAQGLADWYARRERPPGSPAESLDEVLADSALLEESVLQNEFVTVGEDDRASATLLVSGVHCAACVWVIERRLERIEGVSRAHVNLATHRAHLEWDARQTNLRRLVVGLAEIGFEAHPDRPGGDDAIEREEDRAALIRLAVAGFGAMNVMTYSVALYAGAIEGMAAGHEALMRWAGFLVATPVLLFAARPFFAAAVRDLRVARPGMDVPVALAIGGAYLVSVYATFSGRGDVYFDSVCMFTFFLSVGRYLEMRIRHRAAASTRRMAGALPAIARRWRAGSEEVIPAALLEVGDRFRVRPGETLPADGRVAEGRSSVEEALLNGEPWPRAVSAGSRVVAGSINVDSPLLVEATSVGTRTTLARIADLMDRAQAERPAVAHLADRVATVFVTVVLAIAALNALAWSSIDPDRMIWTTLAVLVATCPCALSLATPTAFAAASDGFARAGLLLTNGRMIEGLARPDRFVFDKTGTLTYGEPRVMRVLPAPGHAREEVLAIARSLERDSEHPIARAFRPEREAGAAPLPPATHRRSVPGAGVEALIAGERYRLGAPRWSLAPSDDPVPTPDQRHVWVLLAKEARAIAWFGLLDPVRESASPALAALAEQGFVLEMLSGDASGPARQIARELGLEIAVEGATPEAKVKRVRTLQARGERVVVVGDGLNDAPLLRAGDVSIAMGSSCDLSRLGADAVLMHDDLTLLPRVARGARRVRRVVRQNFAWAIGYNLLVLPLAVTGSLLPWVAALGMSASSLVVVLNALRLRRLAGSERARSLEASR